MTGERSPQRRGLSLAETIISMAIVAVLFSLGILQFRAPVTGAGSKSVAQVLAGQLISARKRAISQHTTVAVVIPSANASRPYAQSFYVMDGDDSARVSQVVNLARDFPRSYVAVGAWDCGSAATVDAPLRQNTPTTRFNISDWLAGAAGYQAKDFVISFTADGKVDTNDLPWTNGQLRLVACSGLDFRNTGLAGTPRTGAHSAGQFELFQVYQGHTVSVTQDGQVWVSPGLAEANPVALSQTPVMPAAPPAAAPVLAGSPNQNPVVLGVESFPQAEAAVPGGYASVIPSSGFVTLVLRVLDSNAGDRLCCRFAANALGGGPGGSFSQGSGFVRMNWDAQDTGPGHPKGCWKATWIWTPPDDPKDPKFNPPNGSLFEITGEVLDSHGGSATFGGGANVVNLQVINRNKVMFSARYQGRTQLFSVSPTTRSASILPIEDGAKGDRHAPSVSPDGNQVLYVLSDAGSHTLCLCNVDGSNHQKIYQQGSQIQSVTWSPDATRYIFQDASGLHLSKLVAGAVPSLLVDGRYPSWNDRPSESWVAFVDPAGNVQLLNPDSGVTVPVTADGATKQYAFCSFNEGSSLVFYLDNTDQVHQCPLTYSAGAPSPGTSKVVSNTPSAILSPLHFWGDPPQVVTSTGVGLSLADYVDGASPMFVQNLGFQIDSPAYTSGWSEVNWTH